MLTRSLVALAVAVAVSQIVSAADKPVPATDAPLIELRVYTATKGKLDALNARFRDHTLKLFEKHGMINLGYWMPIENPDEKLYYLLAHKDRATRNASFKAFQADADWQKAHAESEKDGKLVTKIEEHFLSATDYSPAAKVVKGDKPRVFELRTYTTTEGNLAALNSRFRDHTVKLFEKHGMTNLYYFTPVKGEKDEANTLIYFLAHDSVDAAKKSFDSFRKDPSWIAAKEASEKAAGSSLTTKDGVQSLFLKAVDYSPTK